MFLHCRYVLNNELIGSQGEICGYLLVTGLSESVCIQSPHVSHSNDSNLEISWDLYRILLSWIWSSHLWREIDFWPCDLLDRLCGKRKRKLLLSSQLHQLRPAKTSLDSDLIQLHKQTINHNQQEPQNGEGIEGRGRRGELSPGCFYSLFFLTHSSSLVPSPAQITTL